MKILKYISNSLFLVLMVFASCQAQETVDGVVAIVGDKMVLKSEIESQYVQYLNEGNLPNPKVKCQIVNELLTSKLLLIQAELDSIVISEEEIDGQLDRRIEYFKQLFGSLEKMEDFYGKSALEIKDDFREPIKEQILAQRMQAQIASDIKVTPAEVKTYFEQIPKDSLPYLDTEIEVGQIVIFPEITEFQKQYTIEKLNKLKTRIVEKGESFEVLARLYSEDPGSQPKGGYLGWFQRGDMVSEFEAVVFKLKIGEVSKVFKTQFGYHVAQLIARRGNRAEVRHILIRVPEGNKQLQEAESKLDSIRQNILEEKTTFIESVIRFTEDKQSKNNAGLLRNPYTGTNFFTFRQIEEFDKNIFYYIEKLEPGEFTNPKPYISPEGRKGYRIFYLKSKTKPHLANLNEDYDKIQAAALSAKKSKIMGEWFENNRKKTFFKISPEYQTCKNLQSWINQ